MSKIEISPMMHLDEEPTAILYFGDVKINIPYTLLRYVSINNESINMAKSIGLFSAGINQIEKDMEIEMYGETPRYHRDSEEFKALPFSHNPLHHLNKEVKN